MLKATQKNLMDVKHSCSLKSESKSESGPLHWWKTVARIGAVRIWFGVLLVWAAMKVSHDAGGSSKVVGMTKATTHSFHTAF